MSKTTYYRPADHTAAEWRAMARAEVTSSADSFDNCDTDGFLSQAAGRAMARLYDAVADIAENNGVADVRGLFTAAGDIVTGWKWVDGKYGDSIRADGKWFNPSQATNGARRLSADTKKGFTFGVVRGAAVVRMGNNWTPVIELVAGADVEAVTAVDVTYYRND